MATITVDQLRASLRREELKLQRQRDAVKATQGLIEMLREQIEARESK